MSLLKLSLSELDSSGLVADSISEVYGNGSSVLEDLNHVDFLAHGCLGSDFGEDEDVGDLGLEAFSALVLTVSAEITAGVLASGAVLPADWAVS